MSMRSQSKPFTLTAACVGDWFTTFGYERFNTSVSPVSGCSFRHGVAGWWIFISHESDRCCTGAALLCQCVRVCGMVVLLPPSSRLEDRGAFHVAPSNRRTDPRSTADWQQANGSGFLPVARERWKDITWGMTEREREWVIRNKAPRKRRVTWIWSSKPRTPFPCWCHSDANSNANCAWQFSKQSYN